MIMYSPNSSNKKLVVRWDFDSIDFHSPVSMRLNRKIPLIKSDLWPFQTPFNAVIIESFTFNPCSLHCDMITGGEWIRDPLIDLELLRDYPNSKEKKLKTIKV